MTNSANSITNSTQASSPSIDPRAALSESPLDRIPDELMVRIISLLPTIRDVKSVGLACRYLHQISEADETSRDLFANQFPCAYAGFGRLPLTAYRNLYNAFAAFKSDATDCTVVGERLYASLADGTIKIFDIKTRICLDTIKNQHPSAVKCLQDVQKSESDEIRCVHFDGMYLLTGSKEGTVKSWFIPVSDINLDAPPNSNEMPEEQENDIDKDSSDEDLDELIQQGLHRTVHPPFVGRYDTSQEGPDRQENITSLALVDGKLLSSSNDTTFRIFDLKTGGALLKSPHCSRAFRGHQGEITCLHTYEGCLGTGSHDGTIKIWDQKAGVCLHTLTLDGPVTSLEIMEDRLHAISLESNTLYVWDIATGEWLSKEDLVDSSMLG